MSYILGSVTLPNPKSFFREFIETSKINTTIQGVAKKRVINRKEKFTLRFQYLTQTQVNNILSEYNLNTSRTFTVNEDNLSIGPTDVIIEIKSRVYPPSESQYREHMDIELYEVK